MIKSIVEIDRTKLNLWLKKSYPGLTMVHLQKLCRIGEIRVNGGRVKYNAPLVRGDEIKLPPYIVEYETRAPSQRFSAEEINALRERIIFDGPDLLALDKPAGLASQGGTDVKVSADALLNAAFPDLGGSIRLVHRIDMETSGVLLAAKSYEAAQKYAALFRSRQVEKTYFALVHGSLARSEGLIDFPLPDEKGSTRPAITRFKVLDEASNLISLVQLHPQTGRTHQLRLHMKHIGHPILGDFKYSPPGAFAKVREALRLDLPRNLYLHAARVVLPEIRAIEAPLPPHFRVPVDALELALK